jgi:aminopeptidase N
MQATGPGANFLREGWATFCEWSFLAKQYGPDVEKGIWQTAYNYYVLGGHDGVRSIVGNPDNGSIHYVKGAWIFHMLEETLGHQVFDEGMRIYIQIPRDQKAGYEEFIAAMSKASGRDMSPFITPWVTGKYIPNLHARIEGAQIVVTQQQPDVVFEIPVKLGITTNSGATVEKTIQLSGKTSTLDVSSLGTIRDVRIDPDNELLLLRNRGETVTFTLHNSAAKTVALEGNFTLKPVPATHTGDTWTVTIPMTQGRYSWDWQIDGKKAEAAAPGAEQTSGVQIVEPLQEVQNAYPR